MDGDPRAAAFKVRFKDPKKPYALSVDSQRATLECRTPDGKVQTFTRPAWAR